jgi:general secretion pathway protein H
MRRTWVTGSEAGFTLLELMVVMAILVLIATLLPVALDRASPGRRATTTAERLAATIRDAQGWSIRSGRPATVSVRGKELITQDTVTSAMVGHSLSFPHSTNVSLVDSEGRVTGPLVVYPDGSARYMRFNVQDGGYQRTVLVSAVTGRVTLVSER